MLREFGRFLLEKTARELTVPAPQAWKVGENPPKPKSTPPSAPGATPHVTPKAKPPSKQSYYRDVLQTLERPQRSWRPRVRLEGS